MKVLEEAKTIPVEKVKVSRPYLRKLSPSVASLFLLPAPGGTAITLWQEKQFSPSRNSFEFPSHCIFFRVYRIRASLVRICVALSVGVVVGIEVVLVDVVPVVVVVRVADQHVDDVEDRKEEGDDAECAHAAAGCKNKFISIIVEDNQKRDLPRRPHIQRHPLETTELGQETAREALNSELD